MAEPAEILRAARAKIERPDAWIQRTGARDIDGLGVGPFDPAAVRFSADAAIEVAARNSSGLHRGDALAFFRRAIAPEIRWIPTWNDAPGRTHPEVLAAFDRAIEIAEGEP